MTARDSLCVVTRYFKAQVPISLQRTPECRSRVSQAFRWVDPNAALKRNHLWSELHKGWRDLLEVRASLFDCEFQIDDDSGVEIRYSSSDAEYDFLLWMAAVAAFRPELS